MESVAGAVEVMYELYLCSLARDYSTWPKVFIDNLDGSPDKELGIE
jgi:hypothetical protein